MRTTCFILCLLLAGAACRKPASKTETFRVTRGACTDKETGDQLVRVCLDSVQDSRCPPHAVCVWQGVAIGYFRMQVHGTETRFALSTRSLPGMPPTDTLVQGYRLRFLDLFPYPGTGTGDPVEAEIEISR